MLFNSWVESMKTNTFVLIPAILCIKMHKVDYKTLLEVLGLVESVGIEKLRTVF